MEEYCEGDELDLDMLVQDKIIKYIGICDSVTYEPYFKENKGFHLIRRQFLSLLQLFYGADHHFNC